MPTLAGVEDTSVGSHDRSDPLADDHGRVGVSWVGSPELLVRLESRAEKLSSKMIPSACERSPAMTSAAADAETLVPPWSISASSLPPWP